MLSQRKNHKLGVFPTKLGLSKLIGCVMFILSLMMFYHSGNTVFQHSVLTNDELTETWDYGILGAAFFLFSIMCWKKVFI